MANPKSANLDALPTTAEVDELNDEAWASQYTDPAHALDLATRALNLSWQISHSRGTAYALLNKAFYEVRYAPHTDRKSVV